jgi:glutamate/tyrosine decarboxylase-like PLP-dependent enzyme
MNMMLLNDEKRSELWRQLIVNIEDYINNVVDLSVAPAIDLNEIRRRLTSFDFDKTIQPLDALQFAADNLRDFQVHTPHPRYFGLFNPAPTAMGIAADALVAAFNPQLAAWSHNPFASEVERHLVLAFAKSFGYDVANADGTFCSGGAEANHTALICALVRKFPDYAELGLRALEKQPVFYVSAQSHHSFVKAARFCGLGTNAVREIKSDAEFKMSVEDLAEQIETDRRRGFAPFFIVATAGTTNGGMIDDLAAIGKIALEQNLWFHTDAAWGGAAAFVPEMRQLLKGIERADSITFDAHKWLSVPMGAGIFLTRHNQILSEACRITTDYMPRDASDFGVNDPFAHSMQWSRRFIGLKVFLSLAVAGWDGYAEAIRHQTAMGDYLRNELEKNDWETVNETLLPVVCFRDKKTSIGKTEDFLMKVANDVVASGKAWISFTRLNAETPVLRACITNYRTMQSDARFLVRLLNDLRDEIAKNRT